MALSVCSPLCACACARLWTPNISCSFHIRIFAYLIFVWAIAGSFHCRFIFIFIRREKKNLHLRECFYTLAPSFDLARVHNFREQDWKKQQKYLSATRAWNKKTTDGMKTSTRKCHLHEKRRRWSLLRLIIWCKCYVFPFWCHCSIRRFLFHFYWIPLASHTVQNHVSERLFCLLSCSLFDSYKCVWLLQIMLRLAHFHYIVQYMFFVSTIFRYRC